MQTAEPIATGTYVVSQKGRDRGRVYLVWRVEPPFLYVADGVYRSAGNPKKKRATHVRRWQSGLAPADLASLQDDVPAEQDRRIRSLIAEAYAEVKREVTDV